MTLSAASIEEVSERLNVNVCTSNIISGHNFSFKVLDFELDPTLERFLLVKHGNRCCSLTMFGSIYMVALATTAAAAVVDVAFPMTPGCTGQKRRKTKPWRYEF